MDSIRTQEIAKRVWGWFALFLSAGVFVCLLVNYAISRAVNWALYPTGAAVLSLGIATPLAFGGRHRLVLSVITLAALIMPFLLLIEHLSPASAWAWPVGFPIAAGSVIALLLAVLLFRYTHINRWFCAGIVALTALPINLITNRAIALYLHTSTSAWQTLANTIGPVALSGALFYIGVCAKRSKRTV